MTSFVELPHFLGGELGCEKIKIKLLFSLKKVHLGLDRVLKIVILLLMYGKPLRHFRLH